MFEFEGKITESERMIGIQPKSYELVGLALAGTCMGFLLPFWVPDLGASVSAQVAMLSRTIRTLTIRQWAGLGFWFGVILVTRGTHLRWRGKLDGGP